MASVVIVGIDGLGGTYMDNPNFPSVMPNYHRLTISPHCLLHTLHATTVFPPVSAPAWGSVLTGMTVEQHGIVTNEWPLDRGMDPCEQRGGVPWNIVNEVAEKCGAAILALAWPWPRNLLVADDRIVVTVGSDEEVTSCVQRCGKLPPLTFLHLDDVDHAGHDAGWGSNEYYAACSAVDLKLARVLETVAVQEIPTFVIVCSDHGGSGTDHGEMLACHMRVPLLFASFHCDGKKIVARKNPSYSVLDIAPTDLKLLDINQPHWMRGVPVTC